MNKERKLSKFKISAFSFSMISALFLFFTFATHEVTRFDQIPIKYTILSSSLLIALMIIVFLQNFSNRFILSSQIYFLLCSLVMFLIIEKNLDNTQFVLLKILLILIIALPVYPFVPIITLTENVLFNIGIKNEFLIYLIWLVLLDILFLTNVTLGKLYRKKHCNIKKISNQ